MTFANLGIKTEMAAESNAASLSSVGSSGLFSHFTNELNLDDDSDEDVEVPIDPLLSLFDESAWLVDALPTFHILLTLRFKLSTYQSRTGT